MNFKQTFEMLVDSFEKEKLPYALIGGFALEAAGVVRATMDLDLLVLSRNRDSIKAIMLSNGYTILHESKEVINFIGDDVNPGRVDFLLAHRKYALSMLKRAQKKLVFGGRTQTFVVAPEDLIGLKVQAAANDPDRFEREMVDIRMILNNCPDPLDYNRIEEYFDLFDMLEEYEKLTNAD
ncbi:MAG: hypothetical protein R6V41_13550 [Desulfobacteraceae bacterium]